MWAAWLIVVALAAPIPGLSKRVAVVGGGAGGLFAASRLARLGHDVTLLEKNSACGGRMSSEILDGGYRFDVGPSLLLMPQVYRESFAMLGENIDDHVDLLEIRDPLYRVFFDDAPTTPIDISRDPIRMQESLERLAPGKGEEMKLKLDEYMRIANTFLEFGWPAVIEERMFEKEQLMKLPSFLGACMLAWPLNSHTAMLRSIFTTEQKKIHALLSFQDLYIGLAPSETPAIFSLLQSLEITQGIYYPRGGFIKVAQELTAIAKKNHVRVVTNSEVVKLRRTENTITAVSTLNHGEIELDELVLNLDAPEAERRLVHEDYSDTAALKSRPSCGIVQLHFGLRRKLDALAHHSLFLSTCPESVSWAPVTNQNAPLFNPSAFNFYVHAPSRTDPTACPPDSDALTILVPVSTAPVDDQAALVKTVRRAVLDRLKALVGGDIEADIVCEKVRTPAIWNSDFGLWRGQAFGTAHCLSQLSVLRTGLKHPNLANAWRVGASTRPGNGVPLCLVSGRLVSDAIHAR